MLKIFFNILLIPLFATVVAFAQLVPKVRLEKDPWTQNQLIQPAYLAALLNDPKAIKPLIYNIGVVEDIKGAKNMGAASEKANLVKFKQTIAGLPKNASVVVYCGCCPFSRCPNIRPAFKALQAAGLKGGLLLNLPTNIKVDWIDKGYPLK